MDYINKRILITPLNWGLGHATRCVPLIYKFLNQNNQIAIASDGGALDYLRNEFPTLKYYKLKSYNIKYPTNSALLNMSLLAPRIFSAIKKEHKQIQYISMEWQPDILISDSRFGCYHEKIKSIIISHQIQIQSRSVLARKIARKLNYYWINRFDECWIPDHEGLSSLAGDLAKTDGLSNAKYIGPLSRFKRLELPKKWDAVVVLSGPEPARSTFENILYEELSHFKEKQILFVRGSRNKIPKQYSFDHIKTKDWMQSDALNQELAKAELIICRSGYSSIMDVDKLQIPALFIPTPGQTEQEYLAELHALKGYLVAEQNKKSIKSALLKIWKD